MYDELTEDELWQMRLRNADCALFCAQRLKDKDLLLKAQQKLRKVKCDYARWKVDKNQKSD